MSAEIKNYHENVKAVLVRIDQIHRKEFTFEKLSVDDMGKYCDKLRADSKDNLLNKLHFQQYNVLLSVVYEHDAKKKHDPKLLEIIQKNNETIKEWFDDDGSEFSLHALKKNLYWGLINYNRVKPDEIEYLFEDGLKTRLNKRFFRGRKEQVYIENLIINKEVDRVLLDTISDSEISELANWAGAGISFDLHKRHEP